MIVRQVGYVLLFWISSNQKRGVFTQKSPWFHNRVCLHKKVSVKTLIPLFFCEKESFGLKSPCFTANRWSLQCLKPPLFYCEKETNFFQFSEVWWVPAFDGNDTTGLLYLSLGSPDPNGFPYLSSFFMWLPIYDLGIIPIYHVILYGGMDTKICICFSHYQQMIWTLKEMLLLLWHFHIWHGMWHSSNVKISGHWLTSATLWKAIKIVNRFCFCDDWAYCKASMQYFITKWAAIKLANSRLYNWYIFVCHALYQ